MRARNAAPRVPAQGDGNSSTGTAESVHEYSAEFASGYRVRMTISGDHAECEWVPDVPNLHGQRRRKFLASYRTWRDSSLRDYAKRTRRRVLVVELAL